MRRISRTGTRSLGPRARGRLGVRWPRARGRLGVRRPRDIAWSVDRARSTRVERSEGERGQGAYVTR
nr:MAG: hypothetical protein DIU78_21205 [Pseudomonadota bacterium]